MSCLLAAFAYNIDNLSLLFLVLSSHTVSIVSSFSCCSFCNLEKPYTCVVLSSCTIFGATISHADCGILFSKSCRSKSNATLSYLNLHYSMDNTEVDLHGNIFLVQSKFCTFLLIVLLPVSFS